jgi:hypothetical protein
MAGETRSGSCSMTLDMGGHNDHSCSLA